MRGPGSAEVISQSHLLLDHHSRLALHVEDKAKLLPSDHRSAQQWTCDQTQGLPRWTPAARINPSLEVRLLGHMNLVTDSLSRLAALDRTVLHRDLR